MTQRWLYRDPLEPVAELDANNDVVSLFVYGAKRHVPEYMVKGGATYKIVSDQLGSVRLVANVTTGVVAQHIAYDEFGNVLADTNPGFQPFGFAGGIYDADTGLVRFGARDYDAMTGRWTAKDPILFDGAQANLYAYAGGDPMNEIDPSGLLTKDQCKLAGYAVWLACGAVCVATNRIPQLTELCLATICVPAAAIVVHDCFKRSEDDKHAMCETPEGSPMGG